MGTGRRPVRGVKTELRKPQRARPKADFDWGRYYSDIAPPEGVPENKTAIAIICCNRLHYAKESFESLANSYYIEKYPVFCFLDFPPCGDTGISESHRDLVHGLFDSPTIINRPINFGCGRNHIDARRQLFDVLGYERVFVLEDDCVLDPSALVFCENLMDWAESLYDNVGIVQAWRRAFAGGWQDVIRNVRLCYRESLLAYLQTRGSWDKSRDLIMRFQDKYLFSEKYSDRNKFLISKWKKALLGETPVEVPFDRKIPVGSVFEEHAQMRLSPASQDGVTMAANYLAGYKRLGPHAPRMKYIGEKGIHGTPEHYKRLQYGSMTTADNSGDVKIKSFVFKEGPYGYGKTAIEGGAHSP